jgi:CBS domain-containing protein
MTVSDRVSMLLQRKGSTIFSVPPQATVYSAIEVMAEKSVGALLVIDKGKLLGVISERDYARKVILQGHSSKETLVWQIMTASPITIGPDASVDEAMHVMTSHRIRHLPVIDSADRLIGVLSIGDVVKWIMTSQDAAITHMERYISGDLVH